MNNNHIDNIKTLCTVENFILENDRKIEDSDTVIINKLEQVMEQYAYGWYIIKESMTEQIKSINNFKVYIIDHNV